MLTDGQVAALESAWAPARAIGALGHATIEELFEHAGGFVAETTRSAAPIDGIDIGTGVGVPGLLLALRLPQSRWRLVDASESRCRLARGAVTALALADRVTVVHGRADDLAHEADWRSSADLVVARLFGPPAEVAECGVPLLSPAGRLVVSTSEAGEVDWQRVDLRSLGAAIAGKWTSGPARFIAVHRTGELDDGLPRSVARRRRAPIGPSVSRETPPEETPSEETPSEATPSEATPSEATPREARPRPVSRETAGRDTGAADEGATGAGAPLNSPGMLDRGTALGEDERSPRKGERYVALPAEDVTATPRTRIFAVANQKGGVGKTTTTVNLGACFAELGERVLIIDLDPQANASTGLGLNPRQLDHSLYDVLLQGTALEDVIEPVSVKNLFVAPSSLDLAGAEIELVPAFSRERKLKVALETVVDDYDIILIDCPPSLGLLTINGLTAATEVLVPIQTEYYALEGLGQLIRNVDLVTRNLNPELQLSTIVLVMFDARTKLSGQVADEVREHFGDKVCRQVIPRTVRLSEAPSFGQPITAFDPMSRGAIAYRELAKEVLGGET